MPLARTRQRGAAALIVVLGLMAVLALGTLHAHRGLLLESRMSANQARATMAFEAAEAGLEWAAAQLNHPARIAEDCRPGATETDSFRKRMLDATPEGLVARHATDGGPMRAACVRDEGRWACHCPADGVGSPPASPDAEAPAFVVEIHPDARPGIVRVVSRGRASRHTEARVEALHALRPAVAALPAAAVTAQGSIDAGVATLVNEDPLSGGLVAHAGGVIQASAAQVVTTAGSATAGAVVDADAALASDTAVRRFARTFGLPPTAWARQPGAVSLACGSGCANELVRAAGPDGEYTMVLLRGDAVLSGSIEIGQADRPVALVVQGRLMLDGPVRIHGFVFADGVTWQGTAGGELRGALVSTQDVTLAAPVVIQRDASVLSALTLHAGSFVRLPGSWRDF